MVAFGNVLASNGERETDEVFLYVETMDDACRLRLTREGVVG